jgi:putative PIN family toxin of toxin-antitoxin system
MSHGFNKSTVNSSSWDCVVSGPIDSHNDIIYNTIMARLQITIDTSAFISALLSQRGAAYLLLMLSDSNLFEMNISVALVAEYEDVARRMLDQTNLTEQELDDILDFICVVANKREVFFLWRPFLRDPKDDMVLELAVAAGCEFIVTFNPRHFVGCEQFGIEVVTPKAFLQRIGKLS